MRCARGYFDVGVGYEACCDQPVQSFALSEHDDSMIEMLAVAGKNC